MVTAYLKGDKADDDYIMSLKTIALTLRPKKAKMHSIWYQLCVDRGEATFSILIPELTNEQVLILRDLGYKAYDVNISRKERRANYKRLEA